MGRAASHVWNRAVIGATVRRVRPDLVFVFNPSGVGGLAMQWLHSSERVRVVHDVSDAALLDFYTFDVWLRVLAPDGRRPSLKRRAARALVQSIKPRASVLDLRRSYFTSRYLKKLFEGAGHAVDDCPIIPRAVEVRSEPARHDDGACGIICSGRVAEDKGIHVLLDALHQFAGAVAPKIDRVVIAGPFVEPSYQERVVRQAEELAPGIDVVFLGALDRPSLLRELSKCSIYVLPAVWEEPYSLSLLEGMAAGLAVVATTTGGTPEILSDEMNGLAVPPDDATALGTALVRLVNDPALRRQLGTRAREEMCSYRFNDSIDAIETHLRRQ
jgi:glycosyltransferase involved in cell wall biosynthesis